MPDRPVAINMFNCPAPLKVEAGDDYCLKVSFNNGVTKKFNMTPYFQRYKFFEPLKDEALFKQARIVPSAIVWNDVFDIAIEEVYEAGETVA